MSFEIGDVFGDYEVIGILGAGGMGKVYKVRNVISNRIEAAKVLLPNLESDPALAERFLREIRVHAGLDHPNIAGLHTALRHQNQVLMLVEYVEGQSLSALLRERRPSLAEGIGYISQALAALSYAHAQGVIHRDIKPANMMLTPDGTVKLMDFGVAKVAADRTLTQTGQTVGSLFYMSPEQINGAPLDARSDLYSVGVSLYELLTGKRPFEGDSDYSIMSAHLRANPVAPIELAPDLPPALNEIVMLSIAKDPAQRFQSADAFRNALASVAPAQAAAEPVTVGVVAAASAPAAKPAGSRRGLYMLAGSLATIAVLIVAATQVPKWVKTSAVEAPPPQTAPAETPPTQPASTPPAAEPVTLPPVPEPVASASPSAAPAPAPSRAAPVRAAPSSVTAAQQVSAQPEPVRQPPPDTSQPAPARPVTSIAPSPQVSAPPPDAARPAALREARERMMLMATRIAGVKSSLQNLRQSQARSGLGMRGDVTAAEQRMEFYMDEAQSSLQAGTADDARKNLDSAERSLEFLEKFLGR